MSKVFKVSKSGYYKWFGLLPEKQDIRSVINKEIKQVFDKSKDTYGSPRITLELKKKNIIKSKSTIARYMKALNLQVLKKKNFQKDDVVVICLSGRGDKDMETYLKIIDK